MASMTNAMRARENTFGHLMNYMERVLFPLDNQVQREESDEFDEVP